VAVAEAHGTKAGLALLDALAADEYYLFHAVRADLLRRLGRREEANAAYERAIARCGNSVERAFLERQRSKAADDASLLPDIAPDAQRRAATSSS
jgi:RNA polymerase sigma-70 factor (ECF subfamily)